MTSATKSSVSLPACFARCAGTRTCRAASEARNSRCCCRRHRWPALKKSPGESSPPAGTLDRPDSNRACVTFTCSLGVAEAIEIDGTVDDVMRRADAALYEAKRGGRDGWRSAG